MHAITRTAAILAATMTAATAGVLTASTPAEAAAASPGTHKIIVGGIYTHISVPAVSHSTTDGHTHIVALDGGPIQAITESTSPNLRLDTTIPSDALTPGPQQWALIDSDGSMSTTSVKILRQTRITDVHATPIGHGRIAITATLTMYDGRRGWIGQKQSPVWVQAWTGRAWATVGTLSTDASGDTIAAGIAKARPGRVLAFRLLRPEGSTVTGAATGVYRIRVN